MKLLSPEDIYRAKAERRARLAKLSPTEKVRIMERLQAMGRTMRAARATLRNGCRLPDQAGPTRQNP